MVLVAVSTACSPPPGPPSAPSHPAGSSPPVVDPAPRCPPDTPGGGSGVGDGASTRAAGRPGAADTDHGSGSLLEHEEITGTALGDVVGETVGRAVASDSNVVITSLDDDGRPEFTSIEPDDANLAALVIAIDPTKTIVHVDVDEEVGLGDTATTGHVDGPGTSPFQAAYRAAGVPDEYAAKQWAFEQLSFEAAWQYGRGEDVVVAVVDTGVDGRHPDLGCRVAVGATFLDDRGDGATGDVDPNGHGTHVAGIIAASAGNGIGIRGVAPEATILPIRVLGSDGRGVTSDVAAGITWAVDRGASVINLSLGSTSSNTSVTMATEYAEAHGAVVVAAAGNDGPQGPANHPASLDDVIAVASSNRWTSISSFSTAGDYVDITAPGEWIYSTLPDDRYGYREGTSMATPHVSGVVALMRAVNPDLSPRAVRDILSATAVDHGPVGRDRYWGHGLLDPSAAVSSAVDGFEDV